MTIQKRANLKNVNSGKENLAVNKPDIAINKPDIAVNKSGIAVNTVQIRTWGGGIGAILIYAWLCVLGSE